MDSRVAGYITEVLYELQRPPSGEESDEISEEEKPALPKIFDDDEIIPNVPPTPLCSEPFDLQDDSTMEAVNGTMDEAESNGKCTPNKKRRNSDLSYKNDSEQSNHEMENYEEEQRPPAKKSASAEVKEKLRNNILKHEAEQFQQLNHSEDFHKSLINGITIHKMNGTANESNTLRVNDLRKSSDGNNASTNSNTTTAPSPGSMTIMA
jgi:hypothetical protein